MQARLPALFLLFCISLHTVGCKTVLPGPGLHWVLISKESETEVKAQVLLADQTLVARIPVVGDVTRNWQLQRPRIQAPTALASLIGQGNVAFLLTREGTSQKEEFIPN